MIELVKYQKQDADRWNQFLETSLIDSFLFHRDFMDYHADRFQDHSFLIYRKEKLSAILSGNIDANVFHSHQGLTYGGIVPSTQIKAVDVLAIFQQLIQQLQAMGISEIIYKPTPYIYHLYPSQEDIYALFKLGAEKIACQLSSTIFLPRKQPFSRARKEGIKNAITQQIKIEETGELDRFYPLLAENLKERYGQKPTHRLEELQLLKRRFPDRIRCFVALSGNEPIAGSIIFEMKKLVHVQYIAANEQGKKTGALDLLFDHLITQIFHKKEVFDFGHSNEAMGKKLNESLIFQKEGFGARGVVYETYRLSF